MCELVAAGAADGLGAVADWFATVVAAWRRPQ